MVQTRPLFAFNLPLDDPRKMLYYIRISTQEERICRTKSVSLELTTSSAKILSSPIARCTGTKMAATVDNKAAEENAALELRIQITKEKVELYDLLGSYADLGEENIKHAGYKTVGDAFIKARADTAKKIEKMIRAHEKKFPN